jgi:hypothetical protein
LELEEEDEVDDELDDEEEAVDDGLALLPPLYD